jgi:protein-arginine kinase
MARGTEILDTFKRCYEAHDLIGKKLNFLKSDKLGYLNSFTEWMGTALEISVLLHLPCLVRENTNISFDFSSLYEYAENPSKIR